MALFIGRLHPDTNDKDLEDLFYDFGALTRCEVKRGKGFGFIEYKDKRDAEDAMKDLQGKTILGNRIVIEWARGGKRSRGESRSSDNNACFICNETGHWARDCPQGDRDRKRRRSRSRSPRDRRRRSRSRSRSRSPRDRRRRSRERSKERRSRSRSPRDRRSRERSQSPRERSKSPVSKGNDNADRSPSPKRKSRSPSPKSKSP